MDAIKRHTAALPGALSQYGDFISKNASAVSQIESGLRSLTYIIPGRFKEAEIASESVHSGVQLLSLYHDSLLAKAVARLPAAQRPLPSRHARYTKYWTQKSSTYRRLATLLQTLRYTELLWEMAARRNSEKIRWRVVVIIEIVKAICRLLLLRLTNSRPLLSPPLPEREIDPSKLEQSPQSEMAYGDDESSERSSISVSSDDAKWTMPRTGLSLPSLPQSSDISSYLLSKVITADDIKPPIQLLHRVTGRAEIAEWLYILRPVFYALAMARWGKDKSSWRPWFIGIAIEFGARQMAKKDFSERIAGGLRGLTSLEKEELRKRGWALAWWFMRGAFYENVTKGYVHSFAQAFKGKPLIDLIGVVIEDYEFLWDQYYFATATM